MNPFANDPSAAEVGKGTFRIYCSPCHGFRAQGGRSGPDLTRGTFHAGSADADLFRVIAHGISGTEMPAFSGTFPDSAIWHIVSFLRSASGKTDHSIPAGDARHGEELFWSKGGCGGCHAIGERGMRIGPDLTRVGSRQSAAQIHEAIVDPNRNPTPGYESLSVKTRAGRTVSGLRRGLDDFSVQLIDRAGNFHSFDRSELDSLNEEKTSLMPSGYGKVFAPSELDDLVAFLARQGAGKP